MLQMLIATSLLAATLTGPAMASCTMPPDAGRYMRSESKQLYSLKYKGQTYTFWHYKGYGSDNQAHEHDVILKNCSLAFTGQGGEDVSWTIGVPRAVAIAFATKEVEHDIKLLGRAKIQSRLNQLNGYGLQPEQAEAYKALGFQLPSGTKIYPWIVKH